MIADIPPHKHRRRLDPESGEELHERLTDKDSWARLTFMLQRYKVFWLLAFGLGGWLGTRITEPLGSVPRLQAQVARQDTTWRAGFEELKLRLDHADQDRTDIVQILKVYGKVICAGLSPDDRYKYDIDCKNLPVPRTKGGL